MKWEHNYKEVTFKLKGGLKDNNTKYKSGVGEGILQKENGLM